MLKDSITIKTILARMWTKFFLNSTISQQLTSIRTSNTRIKAIWRLVSPAVHIITILCPWKVFRMLFKIQWRLCWWRWSRKIKPGWSKVMLHHLGPVSPTQRNKVSTPHGKCKFQQDCTGRCWICLCNLYIFQFVFLFCILWSNIQVLWRHLTYGYLT